MVTIMLHGMCEQCRSPISVSGKSEMILNAKVMECQLNASAILKMRYDVKVGPAVSFGVF